MSHIIFGDFNKDLVNQHMKNELKYALLLNGILIYLNEEVNFDTDVERMLKENSINLNKGVFCITSADQKYNSEDMLFPYDNYSEDELFPNGEDRTMFEKICFDNLQTLNKGIIKLRDILQPKNLRIFVTVGYDDNFKILKCSQNAMIEDIGKQVITSFNLESKIYELF